MSFHNDKGHRRSSRTAGHVPPDPFPSPVEATPHSSTNPPMVQAPMPSNQSPPTPSRRSLFNPTHHDLHTHTPVRPTSSPSPPADGISTASHNEESDISYASNLEHETQSVQQISYQQPPPNSIVPIQDYASQYSSHSRASLIARIERLEGRKPHSPPPSTTSTQSGFRVIIIRVS